jgi:hypothetical protein
VLDDLDHRVEQENRQKPNAKVPYLARQMSERKFSGRVVECTRPNPKMRMGALAVCLLCGFGMNTRGHEGLEWFRPPERKTLPPLCVSSIENV